MAVSQSTCELGIWLPHNGSLRVQIFPLHYWTTFPLLETLTPHWVEMHLSKMGRDLNGNITHSCVVRFRFLS